MIAKLTLVYPCKPLENGLSRILYTWILLDVFLTFVRPKDVIRLKIRLFILKIRTLSEKDKQFIFRLTKIKSQALNAKNITGFCVLSFSQFPFCFFVHIQQPSNFAISSLKRSSAVP